VFGGQHTDIHRLFLQTVAFAAVFLCVLSPSFTAQAQDITSNLIGHWQFDENAGTTANDSGSMARNGTLTNMNPATDWLTPGKDGTSHLEFDGDNDIIDIGTTPFFDFGTNFTISAWVKIPRRTNANESFIIFAMKNGSDSGAFVMAVGDHASANDARLAGHTKAGAWNTGRTDAHLEVDRWQHVAISYDGISDVSFYINGELDKTIGYTIPGVVGGALNVTLGGELPDADTNFNGMIDDVRIYDRTLSDEEVLYLFNTVGGPGVCDSSHAGVMIYDSERKVMQYCNATDWITMGANATCGSERCGGSQMERVVFLSDSTLDGNEGAITDIDKICRLEAQAIGLIGDYKAWIGNGTVGSGPATRFEQSPVPYVLVNGTKVADDWSDLTDGTLDNAINTTSSGQTFTSGQTVWTSVQSNGTEEGGGANNHCNNWTTNIGLATGKVGRSTVTDATWTELGVAPLCSGNNRLYCFEQSGPVVRSICTSPDGVEGEINYNTKHAVLQYCNGTDWVTMGPAITGSAPIDNIPTAGLVGHWKLDDGTGSGTAADSAGANTGTLTNMDPATDWITGPDGSALNFDGTNSEYVTVNSLLGSPTDVTLSAWVNLTSWSSWGDDIINLGNILILRANVFGAQTYGVFRSGGSYVYTTVNTDLNDTGWHHLAFTIDDAADIQKVYLDGQLIGDNNSASSIDYNLGFTTTEIGRHPGNLSFNVDGSIDDVRVYNRPLSASEIEYLYLGTGGSATSDSCAGNPAPGTVCNDGSVYAGLTPQNDSRMFVTRCDVGQSWDGSSCTGARNDLPWNNGNNTGYTPTGMTSETNGTTNTTVLNIVDSDSGPAGTQPHQAAQYCGDLNENNKTDWYLPAQNELAVVYAQAGSIGNFDLTDQYWSSTEKANDTAIYISFTDGSDGVDKKDLSKHVRCVRQDNESDGAVSAGNCSNPTGAAGTLIYNSTQSIMQYCNGSEWVGIR